MQQDNSKFYFLVLRSYKFDFEKFSLTLILIQIKFVSEYIYYFSLQDFSLIFQRVLNAFLKHFIKWRCLIVAPRLLLLADGKNVFDRPLWSCNYT